MRAVVQRVAEAQVGVDGKTVGSIPGGLLVFLCMMAGDTGDDEAWMANKLGLLRVFVDAGGKMNRSLQDLLTTPSPAGVLLISQFTLAAELGPGRSKGNRPSFRAAMSPEEAAAAIGRMALALQQRGFLVASGVFGRHMQVHSVNDGPVTLWLDSKATHG